MMGRTGGLLMLIGCFLGIALDFDQRRLVKWVRSGRRGRIRRERREEGEEGGGNGKGSVTEKIKGKSEYRILSWRPRNCQFLYKPTHPRETDPPVEELGVVTKTQELLSDCSTKENDKGFDYSDGSTQNSNNTNSKIAGQNLPLDDLLRHNAICDGCQKVCSIFKAFQVQTNLIFTAYLRHSI